LCAALLFSARIRTALAQRAARALQRAGWTTPDRLLASTWAERVRALNESGYARFDEKTATQLERAARRVADVYGGDLRRLRDEAEHDPERERSALSAFTGIGPVGADIFLRRAQVDWPELYPYVDARASKALAAAGLPKTAAGVARHVRSPEELSRVLDAAIRVARSRSEARAASGRSPAKGARRTPGRGAA